MEPIHSIQARTSALARAAQHFFAEKGDRRWTAAECAVFDALMDEHDRSDAMLQLRKAAAENSSMAAYVTEIQALEAYIRRGVRNTMSTTTPSQGGYTTPLLVENKLMSALKGYGWMRAVCSEMTLTSGAPLNYPTSDGTAEVGERLAQNAVATSLDPTFGAADLSTSKYGSKVFSVPIELLQDAKVDIIAWIAARAMERIGRQQNIDFTVGTGTSQPNGIVTAAAIGKTGLTGQTTTIIYDDLADIIDSVDEGALGMPTKDSGGLMPALSGWMLSQTMRKVIRKVKDSSNRPVWLPGSGDSPPTLLDYPVYINNDVPVPAANAKSLLFGNYSKYMVRDVPQVELYRFDDSAYMTKGQVGFLAIARAGGNLLDAGAVRAYQNSAT